MSEAPPSGNPKATAAPSAPNEAKPPGSARAAGSLPELVRFEKVTKSFGEGREARVAIQDVLVSH